MFFKDKFYSNIFLLGKNNSTSIIASYKIKINITNLKPVALKGIPLEEV